MAVVSSAAGDVHHPQAHTARHFSVLSTVHPMM